MFQVTLFMMSLVSRCTPGYVIDHAIQRQDLAGRDVSEALQRSLASRRSNSVHGNLYECVCVCVCNGGSVSVCMFDGGSVPACVCGYVCVRERE